MALLDVILLYECNLGCDYCTLTPELRQRSLDTAAVLSELRTGRAQGYDAVSFTGGEPTLRRDLLFLVRAARSLGFTEVKLQTNGLALAQPANVDRLIDAGVNLFHVSVHTHLEDAYHRLVKREGTYPLMVAALDHLVARGVRLRADLILTRQTAPYLADAVRWVASRGVRAVDLWYVSLTDGVAGRVDLLPRMSEAVPRLREALAAARALGVTARSLHVPRCLLGEDVAHAYDPGSDRVKVVTPDASFELDQSKLAGRVHPPSCAPCRYRAVCPGLRTDYVAVFGASEFSPVQGGSGASSSS